MRAWTYQQGYPLVRVSLDEGGRVWLQQVWSFVALGWLEGVVRVPVGVGTA